MKQETSGQSSSSSTTTTTRRRTRTKVVLRVALLLISLSAPTTYIVWTRSTSTSTIFPFDASESYAHNVAEFAMAIVPTELAMAISSGLNETSSLLVNESATSNQHAQEHQQELSSVQRRKHGEHQNQQEQEQSEAHPTPHLQHPIVIMSDQNVTVIEAHLPEKIHEEQQQQKSTSDQISKIEKQQQQPVLVQTETDLSSSLPPTCRVQNVEGRTFDRIHFLHMRKAGGTAMRMFFKTLERQHKIKVHVDEGPEFPEQPGDYNNTFYVTVIREPVSRSISQYKFDQRWDCPSQLRKMPNNFKPTLDNQFNSLEEFVRNPSREHPKIRGPLWICSSNCYARWATGILYPEKANVTEAALLQQSREVLNRYNLILVQEWMKDPAYRQAISTIFQTHFPDREYFAECARQSRRANKMVPLVIANATLKELQDNNRVDSALFSEFTSVCGPSSSTSSSSSSLNVSNVQSLQYKKKQ